MATRNTRRTTAPKDDPTKGWNWGAFWLTWIWGIGNNVWLALLALIPFVGIIMAFILGAKGNELAWNAKKWSSVADFRRTQRTWSIIGWVIGGLAILGVIVAIALSVFVFKATGAPVEASREFVADLQANRIDEAYGESSNLFKTVTTKEKLQSVASIQQQRAASDELDVQTREVENANQATVTGTLKGKNGENITVTLRLVKENDRWVVQGYNIK